MKSASGGLISLLNSNQQFIMADLYTFTLSGGSVLRYTNVEASLNVGGNVFDGLSILLDRGTLRSVIGSQVDTLDLTVTAAPSHMIGTTPWLTAAKTGFLDGASLKLERCFMPTFGNTTLGTVILFSGVIAEVDAGRDQAAIRVNSDLHILNRQMPRNMYQPACLNALFDSQCTLTKSSFAVAGAITTANTTTQLKTGISSVVGYHNQGTITFTSGANNGLSRTIKSNDGIGGITLINPLPSIPQATDTFNAYPGCDKQMATCQTKFSNVIHFHGFPFIPAPESVY